MRIFTSFLSTPFINQTMHTTKSMVLPMILLKLAQWILYKILANSCYRAATKVKTPWQKFSSPQTTPSFPTLAKYNHTSHNQKESQANMVFDVQGTLVKSTSFFPFFMLIAFEGGSIFRALLLLLSSPFLLILDFEIQLKVMIFITFCGLRLKDMSNVEKAVLPKFYLENLNPSVYEVLASFGGGKMVFTSLPRVMVEGFLKEYIGVDVIKGTELHVIGKYYSGLVSNSGLLVKHKALKEFFGDKKAQVGVGTLSPHDHLFISLCKEAYVVDNKINANSETMPRDKYPKPLIFHDGRLAFLPTPIATLSMFLWLPLGLILAIFRLLIGILLPYKIAMFLGCASGVHIRVKGLPTLNSRAQNDKGVLYVCTHRTLLDPVFLSTVLEKPLTAVTYSLSKMSEFLSPIRTVRLTRDRKKDGSTMEKLLKEGDLVVCPEGTTCREPYLLRFSSLFAELADQIVPVAMNTNVTMFYGTTASGLKCLDPIFFLMNPRPTYHIQILEKVPKELTVAGGKSSHEVANYIQRQLADALGFECTNFTRRDKYMMLAGNEGVVQDRTIKSHGKSKD